MAITILEAITTCCAQGSTFVYDDAEEDLAARLDILPEIEGELARERCQNMPEAVMKHESLSESMRSPNQADGSVEQLLPTLLGSRVQSRRPSCSSDAEQLSKGGLADEDRTPNFSGDWRLIKVEGDMDATLKDIGYPWLLRRLFSAASYGIGKTTLRMNHSGNELKVVLATEIGESTWVMISDGEEREISIGAPEIERCMASSRWEGEVHVTEPKILKTRRALPVVRRYLQGQKPNQTFVLEQVTAAGKNSKQFYVPIL